MKPTEDNEEYDGQSHMRKDLQAKEFLNQN
jgi:hypothetical protein